jgi:hypothetical protein
MAQGRHAKSQGGGPKNSGDAFARADKMIEWGRTLREDIHEHQFSTSDF